MTERKQAPAPIESAAGTIEFVPAYAYAAPAEQVWQRLRDLHHRAVGDAGALRTGIANRLSPADAFSAYSHTCLAVNAQLALSGLGRRQQLLRSVGEFATRHGTLDGLEGVLCNAGWAALEHPGALEYAGRVLGELGPPERLGGGAETTLLFDAHDGMLFLAKKDRLIARALREAATLPELFGYDADRIREYLALRDQAWLRYWEAWGRRPPPGDVRPGGDRSGLDLLASELASYGTIFAVAGGVRGGPDGAGLGLFYGIHQEPTGGTRPPVASAVEPGAQPHMLLPGTATGSPVSPEGLAAGHEWVPALAPAGPGLAALARLDPDGRLDLDQLPSLDDSGQFVAPGILTADFFQSVGIPPGDIPGLGPLPPGIEPIVIGAGDAARLRDRVAAASQAVANLNAIGGQVEVPEVQEQLADLTAGIEAVDEILRSFS